MSENNVIVAIRALQRRDTGTDSMTQRLEGRLTREGDGWLLTYSEESGGLGPTSTSLRLNGETATLTRSGVLASQMVFQQGRPHTSAYKTPYGTLPMTLHTLRLEWELTQAGGKVFLVHQMHLGGADIGENRLRLTITKKEPSPGSEAKETFL